MASVTFQGNPVNTSGNLPAKGDKLPAFSLVSSELQAAESVSFEGKRLVINIFPSVDTGVCAAQLRTFNKKAAELDNTAVIGVSKDLPFAQARFCGAEGIDNVQTLSAFRSTFGKDYGVEIVDGPLEGLLARAVIVADADGTVLHSELVSEIGEEPNYDAAIAAL